MLSDGVAMGTISNDEAAPSLSIAPITVSVAEGDTGSTGQIFTVVMSPASSQQVTVNYATAGGTATANADYTTASGTLTFEAGDTSKTFAVQITGDSLDESGETFTVALMGHLDRMPAFPQRRGRPRSRLRMTMTRRL